MRTLPHRFAARFGLVSARFLPNGWPDLLRQIVLFCGAYWLYRLVRGATDGRVAEAFGHARDVIALERGVGLFFEPAVQAWAEGTDWVIDVASWAYVNTHFTVTTLTLAFIYLRRNASFYFIRNMFMVAMLLALVGYAAFPTAPPRYMPEWGFTDSVAQLTGLTGSGSSADALYNPFAAVPSMHVAFALMLGLPMARMARRRWVSALWLAYPLFVSFVVVVTANHWWFDAATGALVAAVSALAAMALRPLAARRLGVDSARAHTGRAAGRLASGPPSMPSAPAERPRARSAREYQTLARNRLIESRLTPNAISLTGLALCVLAAVLVFMDYYFLGGLAFIVGSVCDTLDGRYSRMSGKGSSFGAFLDSTLDRMEEGIVLTAVAYQFSVAGNDAAVAACVVAVLASLMVSYTRARAEALGVECKVGIADRAVRVVILSAGLVLAKGAGILGVDLLEPAVWLLAGLSAITVGQRIFHVRKELRRAPAL